MDLAAIRTDYRGDDISTLPAEPHRGIELWLAEALQAEKDATAFSLATRRQDQISVRVVLAKDISAAGLTFYTNGASLKGNQIADTPSVAGVFFWPNLHRQVRFEGSVTPVAAAVADAYFASRPWESQVAAAVSQQSRPVASYDKLRADFEQAKKDFTGRAVPRPATWGGYLVSFEKVEFWQGQPNRLHQRLLYTRKGSAYERIWLQP